MGDCFERQAQTLGIILPGVIASTVEVDATIIIIIIIVIVRRELSAVAGTLRWEVAREHPISLCILKNTSRTFVRPQLWYAIPLYIFEFEFFNCFVFKKK